MTTTETQLKASELRIGNILRCTTREGSVFVGPVTQLLESELTAGETNSRFTYDRCEPIELTPEILETVGFKNYRNRNVDFNLIKKRVHLNYSDDYLSHFVPDEGNEKVCYAIPHIKYLHQLQNLYFALTGEELEINL